MNRDKHILWQLFVFVLVLLIFFYALYQVDNKYIAHSPTSKDSVTYLTQADLALDHPLFLTNDWLLSNRLITMQPTYIGEFPNLQHGDFTRSPHGKTLYQLVLHYTGAATEVAINFPQLFTLHTITMDGKTLSAARGGARVAFTLTPGSHVLSVETVSRLGYYSGMYHPPAISTTTTLFKSMLVQTIAYGLTFLLALLLALFTLTLWKSSKDQISLWFGLLCCSFALYLSYYFVRLFSLSISEYWYLLQSISLYALCFCLVRLTILTGESSHERLSSWIQRILLGITMVLILASLMIPFAPQAVRVHGILTDLYYIFVFCCVLLITLTSRPTHFKEYRWILFGCTAFGVGLLLNLFSSNLFEPAQFLWQFEWCGLFLVILFGIMMSSRNKRILTENEMLESHLEDIVDARTEELSNEMQQAAAQFADIAHDLKAPISATQAFLYRLREKESFMDEDMREYLDQMESKQQDVATRVQNLTTMPTTPIPVQRKPVSIQHLLQTIHAAHSLTAQTVGVSLTLQLPPVDCTVLASPQKLDILLENLIVNALKATPPGGKILLSAEVQEEFVLLSCSDTGCGIDPHELPKIFKRRYVGRANRDTGSGLGLYLVHSTVKELHGEISVSSQLGQGTVFKILLPLGK